MVAWPLATRSSLGRLTLAVTWLTLAPDLSCLAQEQQPSVQPECFSTSSLVGAVLGTFFSTVVAVAAAFLFWWICFRRRFNQDECEQPKKRPPGSSVEAGVGFDNPCFEEHASTDVADGTKSTDDGRKEAKSSSWTPLRFFGPSRSQKKRSMDDSFITEPERVSVQLRGHDFTGLGFNVTGNMRDGIYIKDILNRGPAFESGKIAQGDKILSLTISFRHVVYEDALTILSYASPYDVTLELEKNNGTATSTLKQRKATSATSLAGSGSSIVAVSNLAMPDVPYNDRLVHPLYRSQSIDDLSKVGRADAALRADVKIPSLSAQLAGGALIKSKMQTKANLEVELPHGPDAKMKSAPAAKDVTVDVADISVAPPDVSLTVDKPSKFAKFGIKVLPDFKFRRGSNSSSNSGDKPDTSVQVNLGKLPTGLEAAVEVPDLPKVEIHTPKASDVAIDVDIPDGPNIGVPSVSVQLPSMPDVSVSAPGVQLSADVPDLAPAVDVAIDMDEAKLPKVDVDVAGLSLDVKGPAVEFSAPEISVGAPKIDVDLPDISVAGIEGQVDLPDLSVEPKLPTLDTPQVTVVAPELGLKEAKSGFHIKFPKFGGGGGAAKTKADVADVSLGVAVPEVEVTLPEVNIETETKTKKETPGAKSGFEFKMPKWDTKKKAGAPDVKIDLPEAEIQPATAAGEISVEVKAPEASIEVPAVSVEAAGAKKSKIGMGFSMPKFHMGKGHAEAKDAAAVDVELAAPKIEVAAPQLSVQVAQAAGAEVVLSDEEGEASGAKKKSKFSLKMPKMPKGKVQADVEVGAVSLPKATVELKEDEAEAVDDKDEAGGRSKKSKFGLKMPKWNVNKPQVELEVQGAEGKVELPKIDVAAVDTTLEASTSADINVPAMPSVDVELKSSGKDVTSDDEEEGAKKKAKFSLTMPKFGISKPQVDLPEASASADVNVELPKVEIEASKAHEGEEKASEKKKGFGFGFKMPKMGASGAADVEADLQVNAPKIDVKVEGAAAEENDDHPVGEKKKSKFSLKMPKFGMNKPHVDTEALIVELPSVEMSAEAPEAKIEVDVPKVALPEAQVSVAVAGAEVEHDSDDEKDDVKSDKKKMKFGLKMPKFSINKPHAEVEVDVNAPALTATAPQVEIEAKAGDEHPEKKKSHGFGISMPKFFGGGAKAEVDVDVPDLSKEMAVEASVDVSGAGLEEAGDDGDHGNKKKIGLKLPKFGSLGLGKPQADVEVEMDPSLDINLPSASLGVSHDEGDESKDADHNKGKSKFSMKMPKFHGSAAVPSVEVAGDMAAGAEIELPQVDVQLKRDEENDSDDEAKKTKKGAKFGIKLPGLHFDKSHGDDSPESSGDEDEAKSKKTKVGIKLPKIGFSKPQIDADVDVKAPSVTVEGDIQAPQFGIEAQLSDDEPSDEKITKFGIKLPSFGLKKPSVDVDVPSVDAEVNVPNLAVQVDVEPPKVDLEVDAPKVELEVPAVSVELDAGEDETGAKKKAGIGFKLPKFSKKSADLDIAVEGDVAAREVDEDSDDDSDKKKIKFGIKMPKFGIKKPNLDVDVDLSSTKDIVVEADVEAPKIDLNDAAITTDIDAPKVEVEVPAVPVVELDIAAPSVDITAPEVSVDVPDLSVDAAKKKGKFSIDMPKINFSKPSFDIKLGGTKDVSVDVPELAATGVSVEIPDVEVSAPSKEIEVAASVEVPKVDVDVDADVDVDVEKKKGKGFTFKMPKIHLGKPHAEVKVDAPKDMEAEISVDVPKVSADVDKIEIDLPKVGLDAGVSASKDDADSDDEKKESGKKKSHRFGIKMPKFHMNKPHAEVELPSKEVSVEGKASLPKVEVEAEEEHEGEGGEKRHGVKAKFGIKMPKFHLNKATDVELAKEESKNQGAKDADSDDESADKKSSATIEVAVPKIGLEAPSLELDTGLSAELAEGKINLPKTEVDLKLKEELEKEAGKKKGKFSFKMPKFHGHVGTKSHGGAEVEMASPSASLDPTINVNVPKVEVEAQAKAAESDDEAEGAEKKKSKFAIRMPKLRKPHIDVDVDASKAVNVDVTVPKVDLPSVTAVIPKVELEAAIQEDDESDDESDKKKTKFAFKRPKMYVKPELEMAVPELNIGAVEVSLPDVDINAAAAEVIKPVDIDLPDLEAKMDIGFETESDEDKNKGGIALDLTAPAMALESKIADLGLLAAAADVELPSVDVAVQPVDVEVSPDLGSLDTAVDVKIKKPKFGFKLPSLHPGKAQVEVPAPEIEANVEVPSVSVEVKHEDSDSEDDKKPTKFGIKMPKFHLGKKEVALPSATVEVPKVELAAEAEDAATDPKVKTMKFDIDLPELKMIDPTLDVDQPNLPAAEVPAQIEVEVKKPKFGIKLPVIEFGKPKVTTSVDVEVSKDLAEAEISLPQVQDIQISPPELEALLPSVEFTDLNVPDIHLATESINECVNFDVNLPDVQVESPELAAPKLDIGGDVDVTIDAPAVNIEVPQIDAALIGKKEDDISDDERGNKSSGFSFGLKMPKFSLGAKEKSETAEPKVEIEAEAPKVEDAPKPAVSVDLEAPKLNVEVSAHPPQVVGEKEKKKFNLGLKMPKLNLSKGHAEGEAKEGEAESKSVKINVKPPKPEKKKKQKANEEESDSEHSDDESKDKEKESASLPSISSVDIKLPRVPVYKSIEHPEGVRDHEGRSSDEEDDVKDIKKNIGARFGVKLKKPKMFTSSKAEITKGDASSAMQPEWKLPRVDLRRTKADQELTVDIDSASDAKLEQLSPSERAEAIRRDAKMSAGIRVHSPGLVLASPRSKKEKSSLQLDVESQSSPRLLSVTRLDPTPPAEQPASQPLYIAPEVSGQVPASEVPSSVLMASEAVKLKRGPITPAKRTTILDTSSPTGFSAAIPVTSFETKDVTPASVISGEVSVISDVDANQNDNGNLVYTANVSIPNRAQVSDTDISITTSTGSDTLVISTVSSTETPTSRKAASLGDLTRITHASSNNDDGTLERTVSLDFKPVAPLGSSSSTTSRAIHNLAVQDLSRVGEDSDEDYSLNRKRPATSTFDSNLNVEVTGNAGESEAPHSPSKRHNRTLLAVDTDGSDVSIRPLDSDSAEALWFNRNIQIPDHTSTTHISYTHMESLSADVTLTTSLGTSPSDTSTSSSDGSPISPASPEPSEGSLPLMQPATQVENGSNQQYHTEVIEINQDELDVTYTTGISTRGVSVEVTSAEDESQPQPLTDLNPSAGNFAAVRNRFEQLSNRGDTNGSEVTVTRTPRLSQGGLVKRLSGTFEDVSGSVNLVQKSVMHIAPELSEGALSRTVIISSLQLDRSTENPSSVGTGVGPESPVPKLEPPC